MNQIQKILLNISAVDKLFSDKVEEWVLIEELPRAIRIGEKVIYVGNFTVDNNYKFWIGYGKILACIGAQFVNFEMLAEGGELYKSLMLHKKLYKMMIKLIGKTLLKQEYYFLDEGTRRIIKHKNCNIKYFKQHITLEKLIEICFLIYTYNFDLQKKNWQIIIQRMEKKELMGHYMSFWLQNMDGLTGKFLNAHITKPASWSENTETAPLQKQTMKKNTTRVEDGKRH